MQKATVAKHVERLRKLARRNHGVLPTAKWLNERGYFGSYDVVRGAGLLKLFRRAFAK
jgi:hypothetical protein